MRLGVLGGGGRLGQQIVKLIEQDPSVELVALWCRPSSAQRGLKLSDQAPPLEPLSAESLRRCELVLDVSMPEGTAALLQLGPSCPVVCGVTGLTTDQTQQIQQLSEQLPILYARNFSPGVALMRRLLRQAAAALPDYQAEILELHHQHKLDAPSGTALALAEEIARAREGAGAQRHGRSGRSPARDPQEIGIHALRGGEVIGEHQVFLLGAWERLEISHRASSRALFADGALRAARWLVRQEPGLYEMGDIFNTAG